MTDTFSAQDRLLTVILSDEEIFFVNNEGKISSCTSPLSDFRSLKELTENYAKRQKELTNSLLRAVQKKSGGYDNVAITGKSLYQKMLLGLPIESPLPTENIDGEIYGLAKNVLLLPALNEFVGAEVLAECVKLKEKSLLVDCEKTVTLYLIGEKDDLCTAIWDCNYDEMGLRCIRAAAKYLYHEEKFSAVYLYGTYLKKAEDALDEDFACIRKEKSPLSVLDAVLTPRTRANLQKEKNRTTFIRVYDRELFQRYLVEW